MKATDLTPFSVVAAEALDRLKSIPARVLSCVNDGTVNVYVGAKLRPHCILNWFGRWVDGDAPNSSLARFGPPTCIPGPDAIVEALEELGANVTYDRFPFCEMVHLPSDSSITTMYPSDTTDVGHESSVRFYGSREFVDWLLSHRLENPPLL